MDPTPTTHNLDQLLQTIRHEGLERAQQEADRLLAAARAEAAEIRAAAEREVEHARREADAQRSRQAAADGAALARAARDTLLGVRVSLAHLLAELMRRDCRAALTGEILQELLLRCAAGVAAGRARPLEATLAESERAQLTDRYLAQLQRAVAAGIEVRFSPALAAGFRVGMRDEALRLEVTDEAIADALAAVVTPRFAALFDACRAGGEGAP